MITELPPWIRRSSKRTIETHQNDYRNPKIAEAMKNLAYVNQFGRGIATVQAALHTNGNQPAEFDIGQVTFFLVKVLEANP